MVAESEQKGLLNNCKKTESISKKKEAPTCNLKVKDNIIKQVSAFNYLGSTMTEDSRCVWEVKRRIALAKSAFSKLEEEKKSLETGH